MILNFSDDQKASGQSKCDPLYDLSLSLRQPATTHVLLLCLPREQDEEAGGRELLDAAGVADVGQPRAVLVQPLSVHHHQPEDGGELQRGVLADGARDVLHQGPQEVVEA